MKIKFLKTAVFVAAGLMAVGALAEATYLPAENDEFIANSPSQIEEDAKSNPSSLIAEDFDFGQLPATAAGFEARELGPQKELPVMDFGRDWESDYSDE
ncbi:MAG: hypothetical protein WBI20_08685 [Burkholderiaceae bacterium]